MARYVLRIAYDGSEFHGWQRQKNANSVQETLENSLGVLLDSPTSTMGCGRTDTGVHASDFYLHFDSSSVKVEENLPYSLNQLLPSSIAVYNLWEVPEDTHMRFDALSRSYSYHIHQLKDPFVDAYSHYFRRALDLDQMNVVSQRLLEHEDFGSFCKSRAQNKTNICHLSQAEWSIEGSFITFKVTADRFLRNMVRALVGTILDVGLGKTDPSEFDKILLASDRTAAGLSVPAKGLFLRKVNYDKTSWQLIS